MSFTTNQFGSRNTDAAAVLRTARQSPAATSTISTAAGHDETIPRTFLALADLGALAAALVATSLFAPWVQRLLLSRLFTLSVARLALPSGIPAGEFPRLADVAWLLAVMAPSTLLFMELLGGYGRLVDQSRARLVAAAAMAPVLSLGLVALALVALKSSSTSRVFIFTFGTLSVTGLVGYRSALRLYKERRLAAGVYAKNVVLVGHMPAVAWMSDYFRLNVPPNRYQLAGWLSVDPTSEHGQARPDVPRLGAVEDLGSLLINRPLHEVIAVQSSSDRDWLKRVIEECDYFRVCLRIVPEALLVGTLRDLKLVFRSEPLRLPEIVLAPPYLETDALFLKRMFDLVTSAALLVVLFPLLLVIVIAIKITTPDLPVLFPWRVVGLKGRAFTGYKFTTMVADAEERRDALAADNEMQGPVFKLRDDPRVTPLGQWLRKYSLNELPQLWSVLKGDMSLVGPRPAFRHELDRYALWQKRKLCVKPGITCLWQVSGRNRINNFDDWVRLDLQYIDQWSLWLDVRILARTVWAVVAGTGS